jgi:hypothetical protein
MRRSAPFFFASVVLILGCGGGESPVELEQAPVDLDPEDSTILMRPFTAEEIRDEWADDGSVVGEPSVVRSTWVELRDHASFPAAHSSREWVSRSTMLGDFEGWLYRVANPDAAVVNEFFFVPSLPGTPVQVRALDGDATVFELEQTARLRPNTE